MRDRELLRVHEWSGSRNRDRPCHPQAGHQRHSAKRMTAERNGRRIARVDRKHPGHDVAGRTRSAAATRSTIQRTITNAPRTTTALTERSPNTLDHPIRERRRGSE
jgi:hypothetical protein